MIRILTALMVMLAGSAWATYPDANTVGYWPLTIGAEDASGNGYTLIPESGTPAWATIDTFKCSGPFDTAGTLITPAGFNTAFSNLGSGTMEWCYYPTSPANNDVMISWHDTVGGYMKAYFYSGYPVLIYQGYTQFGGPNPSNNTWNYAAYVWTPSSRTFYYGVRGGSVASVSDAHDGTTGTQNGICIGRLIGVSLNFHGYVSKVVVHNIALPQSSLPSVPDAGSPTWTPTPSPVFSPTITQTSVIPITPQPRNSYMPKPMMMFNSPGGFGHYSDVSTRALADALISSGLINYGWNTVHIDCGWNGGRDGNGDLTSTASFPNIPSLATYIHSKGLKFSLFTSDGLTDCSTGVGSYGYLNGNVTRDANTFAAWGVDDMVEDHFSEALGQVTPRELQWMYNATQTNSSSRPMTYQTWSVNQGSWTFGPASHFNSWWVNETYPITWANIIVGLYQLVTYAGIAGQGVGWNNAGEIWIGAGSPGTAYPNPLTLAEQKGMFYIWCIEKSVLFVYDVNPATMSADTSAMLKNSEAIAVNQDSLGVPGTTAHDFGDGRYILSCPLSGSRKYALLFINNSGVAADFPCLWSYIGESGKAQVRDIDTHTTLGQYTTSFTSAPLPYKSVQFLTVDFNPSKSSSIYLRDSLKLRLK